MHLTKGTVQTSGRISLGRNSDELLYERGRLVTDGIPFGELMRREHINLFAQPSVNLLIPLRPFEPDELASELVRS